MHAANTSACPVGCDACEQYGRDALAGEFDPPPAPAPRPDPNRPRTTPANLAFLLGVACVGKRGETRRLAKHEYFDAQDAVHPEALERVIAKVERKRAAIQQNAACGAWRAA